METPSFLMSTFIIPFISITYSNANLCKYVFDLTISANIGNTNGILRENVNWVARAVFSYI